MSKMKKMFKFRRSTTDLSEWNKNDEKLWVAVQSEDVDKIETLLTKKSIMATKFNPQGFTTFNRAASSGKTEAVRIFLEQNIDVNAVDQTGQTALHCACRNGQLAVVHQLLQANSNISAVDHQDLTPLHHACMSGSLETVQLVLQNKGAVNAKDKLGRTPIFVACRLGSQPICKELLDRGANINERDKDKKSPLMFGAAHGHEAVCDQLVKGGANVLMTDNSGHTAAWFAEEAGYTEIKKILDSAPSRASWGLDQVTEKDDPPGPDGAEPMNYVSTFKLQADEDSPERSSSSSSPDRPKGAPPPPPGFGTPSHEDTSHIEQLEFGVVPMSEIQDDDVDPRRWKADEPVEARVLSSVDAVTAQLLDDDTTDHYYHTTHPQVSPEAVAAVEAMMVESETPVQPPGVTHGHQQDRKAVDIEAYKELEEEHECLNSELQRVAVENKHLQEKVEVLERRLSNSSSGTPEAIIPVTAPVQTAIDSTIIETLEEELHAAREQLDNDKERRTELEDEVKQLRKQIDNDSKPEAERNADDSWNDSDDDLFESDNLKKSSSGGTDAALIALLRSQILGLERENEELKGRLQIQTFSSDVSSGVTGSPSESTVERDVGDKKRFQELQHAHQAECQQLRNHIEELLGENTTLSSQLTSAIEQKTQLAMAKDNMEVKVSELSHKKTHVESELQRLQSLIDNPAAMSSTNEPGQQHILEEKRMLAAELEILQTENQSLKAENDRLNAEFVEIDSQVQGLQSLAEFNTELQQENEKLRQENEELIVGNKENAESDQKAMAQLTMLLQQENNDLKSDNRTLKSKVAEIERSVKDSLAQKDLEKTRLNVQNEENSRLKSEVEALKQTLAKQKFDLHSPSDPADISELKSQISHLKNTISQQQETIMELMQQSARDAQLRQDYETLQQESEVLKNSMEQFQNLMQTQSDPTVERAAHAEQVSVLEQEIRWLQDDNMQLKDKLSQQTSGLSTEVNNNFAEQLSDLEKLNKKLKSDNASLQETVFHFEKEISASKLMSDRMNGLEAERDALQEQLATSELRNNELAAVAMVAKQNTEEITLLQRQKDLLEDEKTQLHLKNHQAEMALFNSELLLKQRYEGLEEENTKLKSQVAILDEQLSESGKNTPDYFELKAQVKQLEASLESERNATVMTILDGRTAEQKSTENSLKEEIISLTEDNKKLMEEVENLQRRYNNGNVDDMVRVESLSVQARSPQLTSAPRNTLNGNDGEPGGDSEPLDFGKSLKKRSLELRMKELEEDNDHLRHQVAKLVESSQHELNEEQTALATQQILTLQEKLEEVERRHRDVVSTYRTHLLRAVQGQMGAEVQQALKHIIKIRKSPEEFC